MLPPNDSSSTTTRVVWQLLLRVYVRNRSRLKPPTFSGKRGGGPHGFVPQRINDLHAHVFRLTDAHRLLTKGCRKIQGNHLREECRGPSGLKKSFSDNASPFSTQSGALLCCLCRVFSPSILFYTWWIGFLVCHHSVTGNCVPFTPLLTRLPQQCSSPLI